MLIEDIEFEEQKPTSYRATVKINLVIDFKFIAILPALNINLHSYAFEFEWLILGVYITKEKR